MTTAPAYRWYRSGTMKPLALIALAGVLAIGIATFMLPWYTATAGTNQIEIAPGKAKVCSAQGCKPVNSDGLDYDSTWLGLTSACRIAALLGLLACGGAAAMALSNRVALGSGTATLTRGHLVFAAMIGLALAIGSLLTKPAEVGIAAGVFVTIGGYLAGLVALAMIKATASTPAL